MSREQWWRSDRLNPLKEEVDACNSHHGPPGSSHRAVAIVRHQDANVPYPCDASVWRRFGGCVHKYHWPMVIMICAKLLVKYMAYMTMFPGKIPKRTYIRAEHLL